MRGQAGERILERLSLFVVLSPPLFASLGGGALDHQESLSYMPRVCGTQLTPEGCEWQGPVAVWLLGRHLREPARVCRNPHGNRRVTRWGALRENQPRISLDPAQGRPAESTRRPQPEDEMCPFGWPGAAVQVSSDQPEEEARGQSRFPRAEPEGLWGDGVSVIPHGTSQRLDGHCSLGRPSSPGLQPDHQQRQTH